MRIKFLLVHLLGLTAINSCATMLMPDYTNKTETEYQAFKSKSLQGYKPDAKQVFKGQMNNFGEFSVRKSANTCAVISLELATGSTYGDGVKYVAAHANDGSPNSIQLPGSIWGRGGIWNLSCNPEAKNFSNIKIGPANDGMSVTRFENAKGTYTLTVYTKASTPEDYARETAAENAEKEQFKQMKEAQARKTCAPCRNEWNHCMATNNRNGSICGNKYDLCLGRASHNAFDICPTARDLENGN